MKTICSFCGYIFEPRPETVFKDGKAFCSLSHLAFYNANAHNQPKAPFKVLGKPKLKNDLLCWEDGDHTY